MKLLLARISTNFLNFSRTFRKVIVNTEFFYNTVSILVSRFKSLSLILNFLIILYIFVLYILFSFVQLFKSVQVQQKVPFGVNPKTILLQVWTILKGGQYCKCKFSHDLNVERKSAKIC